MDEPPAETASSKAPTVNVPLRPNRQILPPRSSHWFWTHARKVVVAVTGLTLLLAGVAMLVLPGPGWVTIFGALALLATEFTWAGWVLKEARRRFNSVVDAVMNNGNHRAADPDAWFSATPHDKPKA